MNPQDSNGSTPGVPGAPAAGANDQHLIPQPVAYDQQGHPLYAFPPNMSSQAEHVQSVHIMRPMEPEELIVPERLQQLHEESERKYPQLNLSEGEFVISAVKRHPIGLFQIWGGALLLLAVLAGAFTFVVLDSGIQVDGQMTQLGVAVVLLLGALIFGGAFAAMYVYNNNRFYLTNESVIQEIQIGLLNKHEQTVSLENIEDASYYQRGLLPYMFNYGAIRLSTQGDETTYRFNYVADPKHQIAVLNNAVEAFKNGRPVELPDR